MIKSPVSKVPRDFTKFMKCGENKTYLINLISEAISNNYKRALALLKWNEFYLSKEISGIQNAVRLKSNQKEVDRWFQLFLNQ